MNDYALALSQGRAPCHQSSAARSRKSFTNTPASRRYIEKADLRIDGGEFEKTLQDEADLTTGRLDSRFSGPTIDPLSKEADYDPQSAAISFGLRFSASTTMCAKISITARTSSISRRSTSSDGGVSSTRPPGARFRLPRRHQRDARSGNRDEIQPEAQGAGERRLFRSRHALSTKACTRCSICRFQRPCTKNIEFQFYESGHMVYAHEDSLKAIHDNVAALYEARIT